MLSRGKIIDKLIFLDVDGVINHTSWYRWIKSHPDFLKEGGHRNIDPKSVDRIIKICDEANAYIVMSSSWRLWDFEQTLDNLNRIRDLRPILDRMVGITPRTEERNRGKEIQFFLNACETELSYPGYDLRFIVHPGYYLKRKGIFVNPHPKYIILDDELDMLDNQQQYFIHINDDVGITHKDVENAIKMLNGTD